VRGYDSVGRYGGEEFLVVLPGCDSFGAFAQAERIREVIANPPFSKGTQPLAVTCSIGAASRNFPAEGDADALRRESDAAMYRAKSDGRNRVALAQVPDLV
jgi:diguanylate cyclase (GGDEF)-like protein